MTEKERIQWLFNTLPKSQIAKKLSLSERSMWNRMKDNNWKYIELSELSSLFNTSTDIVAEVLQEEE